MPCPSDIDKSGLICASMVVAATLAFTPAAAQTTLTFIPMAEIATGSRTAAVIALDVNKDGVTDIVATNQGDGTINVALGGKGGRFKAPMTYRTSTVGPYETAAADFDGDGFPDLVSGIFGAARGEPYGRSVSVHLNKGDGTFRDFVDFAATSLDQDKVRAVTTGDFNGDGRMDIAAAAQHSGLQILLGKGDGTFARPVLFPAGGSVHGVVAADFNRDGKLDLAFANNGPRGRMTVLSGKGDGTFAEPVMYPAGSGTFGLDAGDLNGDGWPDIVTANQRGASVSIFFNQASKSPGAFAAAADLAASGSPVAVTVGDVNGDGKADILVSSNSGGVLDLFLANGDGTFATMSPISVGGNAYDAAVADFDRDGIPDIACALTNGRVIILKGNRAK